MTLISVETFARLSWERDVAVGGNPGPFEASRELYKAEARMYAEKPRINWPCGILIKVGCHKEDHPDCPPNQDWRE